MSARVEVIVNGERRLLGAGSLEHALVELGFGAAKVATAVNGDFVPAARRGALELSGGDRIEIVTAREGG